LLAAVGGVLLLFLFVGGCAAMGKNSQRDAGPNSATPPSSESSSQVESQPSSTPEPEPEEKPDDVVVPAALTRGEFAALLANKLNVSVGNEVENVFPDLESHYAKKSVLALLKLGILSEDDYKSGFAPKTPITRMEAIKLLVIAMDGEADADKFEGKTSFADDAKIPQELKGYAVTAEKLGLPVTFSDNTIRPDAPCVREEAVALIDKLKAKAPVFVDGKDKTDKETEDKKEDSKPGSSSKPSTSGKPSTPAPTTPTKPTTPPQPTTPAPAAKVSFELPRTAHTDTEAELKSSFENTTKLEWVLKKDSRTVDVADYLDGNPSKDKTVTFTEQGSYELTLNATGKDGKVVTVSRKTT
ncbi:MAG: S-layer homology domain-containing protein, partial [Oscillospiraceae bacterium]